MASESHQVAIRKNINVEYSTYVHCYSRIKLNSPKQLNYQVQTVFRYGLMVALRAHLQRQGQ